MISVVNFSGACICRSHRKVTRKLKVTERNIVKHIEGQFFQFLRHLLHCRTLIMMFCGLVKDDA